METVSKILSSIFGLIQETDSNGGQEDGTVEKSSQQGTTSRSKRSRQAPILDPRSYESLKWEERLKGGYRVKFRTGTKLTTIFRFLLAKVVYDTEDGLHLDEYLALMEAYLQLRNHKDPTFLEKYGEWLITIQPFIASLAEVRVYPLVPKMISPELQRALAPLLPSPSAYFGYKGNPSIRLGFNVIVRNPFFTAKKLPPPRFIGVGYKDKGTRRKPELDGSPRWQDVAMRLPTSETPTFESSENSWKPRLEKSEFVSLLRENLQQI